MSKQIALVTIAVMVDGMRQEFAPGSELPEINPHDLAELKRMGAVKDLDEDTAAKQVAARALADAGLDFEEARASVQAAQASIQQEADATAPTTRDAEGKPKAARR